MRQLKALSYFIFHIVLYVAIFIYLKYKFRVVNLLYELKVIAELLHRAGANNAVVGDCVSTQAIF